MGNREQLERQKDVGMAQWQLYLSVIGVLFIVFGGSLAIVLGGLWYLDRRNGIAGAGILAGWL